MYALIAATFVSLLRLSDLPSRRWLRWTLCALVLGAVAYQVGVLARDVVTGDGSSDALLVEMRYPTLRIPPGASAARIDGAGKLAADFATVYFPIRDGGPFGDAYVKEATTDPWQRTSRFAPLIYFVCAETVCRLPYGWASLVHLTIQLVLLGYSLIRAHRLLGLRPERLTTTLVLVGACLFLTPVGLSSFERGQWSIYVGLAYLWLLLGLLLDRPRYVVAGAILAFVKWTSLPTVSVILGVYVLGSSSLAEAKRRSRSALLFGATFAVLFLCLPADGMAFLERLSRQEFRMPPDGLSLIAFFPRPLVKLLPLALTAVGAACLHRRRGAEAALVPFAAGAAIILLGYPTVAHDYSMPSILGFVPLISYWAATGLVSPRLGSVVSVGFWSFLVLASWSREVFDLPSAVLTAYAGATLALTLATVATPAATTDAST